APAPPTRSFPLAKLALGVGALGALIALGRYAGGYIPVFQAWVEGLGPLGPIVFVVGYAVAVVAFIPGSALTLASGAIFGVAQGTLLVFVAAVLGSMGAFLVARHLARAAIERRIAGDARFAAIDQAIAREGRKIVFLLRLSPIFPFNLLNYALGLTRVRLVDYAIAGVGMLPGTLLYVYLGSAAGQAVAAAGGAAPGRSPAEWALFGVGLLATAVVTVSVTRIARRALRDATGQ
ncbi:MAG: TVP38/TMEM64 family protein, partial [Myxococcota bacterium]